jgi:ribosomal protein L40E
VLTKRTEIAFFLVSLLLLSCYYVPTPKVQAIPEEVKKVKTEIKLSEMEGWPGGSKVGVAANLLYKGEYEEKEINLKFSLPPYLKNIISAKIRLYLFAYCKNPIGYVIVDAVVEKIELNGYVISTSYGFYELGRASYPNEKSSWVEWEIPFEFLRPEVNSLFIKIKLIVTGSVSSYRLYYEFYIYDYSSIIIERQIKQLSVSFTSEPNIQGIFIDGNYFPPERLPCSFIWEEGSTHTFSIPKTVIYENDNRTRYVFTGWSDGNVSASRKVIILSSASYTAMFKVQHYVNVSSEYGSVSGSGWYDEGSTAVISVSPEVTDFGNGTRRIFKSWIGDYSGSSATAKITVDSPKNVKASWGYQYYLTVISEYGPPSGGGWYYPGQTATVSVPSIVNLGSGVRKVFAGWVGDFSSSNSAFDLIVNRPMVVTAKWKTQYFLKVETPYSSAEGEGWYDEGTEAYARLKETEVTELLLITRYFTHWAGDASGTKAVSNPIVMDSPKTAIAVWGWKPSTLAVGWGVLAACATAGYVLIRWKAPTLRARLSTLKTCPKCGAPVEPGANYCWKCGAKLSK